MRPYKPFGMIACVVTAVVGAGFAGFGTLLLIYAVGLFSGWYSVAFPHVWISIALGVAFGVFSFLFRSKHLDEENDRKLKEWRESDARLQNPEYAHTLKKAGFNVPAKYLDS